jgi:hypothetical protein
VSATGLGSLSNSIGLGSSRNYTFDRLADKSCIPLTNTTRTVGGRSLTTINGKSLFYQRKGTEGKPPIVFVHGLGGSTEYWNPVIEELGLEKSHSLHLFDQEGLGLSATSPLSVVSISTLAADVSRPTAQITLLIAY